MVGRSKRRGGCWTCRLRRKGCDGARPTCRTCVTLEITCYDGEAKPDWMDGAVRRKEMARRIKAQIKDSARGRRERRAVSATRDQAFIVISQQELMDEHDELSQIKQPQERLSEDKPSSALTPRPHVEECDMEVPSPDTTSSPSSLPKTKSNIDGHDLIPKSILDLGYESPQLAENSSATLTSPGRAWEMDFIMIYLDYVSPFLFPFYRPPLFGTSRAWLLSFIRQNSAVFHSVLSLSSFFFTVALKDVFGEREPCKSVVWRQVVNQAAMSFEMIQKDLVELNDVNARVDLLQKAHLMETIVQLLVFELFVSRSADWDIHLMPVITLFEEIFEEASWTNVAGPGLECILGHMAWSRPSVRGLERPVWNPDQAAFRFFTAILVFIDIVASTSLERAPLLRNYHSRILADSAPEQITGPLDLSAFVGCDNWVLLAVGEISALDAWKKKKKIRAGDLLQPYLEEKAYGISRTLEEGLYRHHTTSVSAAGIHDKDRTRRLRPYYHDSLQYTVKSTPGYPLGSGHTQRGYTSLLSCLGWCY
jgi:hypothetical protein